MKVFEIGQEVTMFVKGAGVTSEEKHKIDNIVNEIITLEESEKKFDIDGKWLDVDNFFGFNFWIE